MRIGDKCTIVGEPTTDVFTVVSITDVGLSTVEINGERFIADIKSLSLVIDEYVHKQHRNEYEVANVRNGSRR